MPPARLKGLERIYPLYTIGHSTRSIDDFIELLKKHEIVYLVDIRTIPRSRHNPQFNEEDLNKALKKQNITYIHMKGLGGLRKPNAESINQAWHNASFRGFADYMQKEEFGENLCDLLEISLKGPTALMCAEAVPWRCHRSLIADALFGLGIRVEHIISKTSCKTHQLTGWAKLHHGRVYYPL